MSERRLRGVIAAFAAIGAALAGYLVFERYTGGVISCTTGGCETVQHSSYSSLAGIPVAVLGLCAYVAIFALSFVLTETARAAQLAIALAGVASSAATCLGAGGSDRRLLRLVPGKRRDHDRHRAAGAPARPRGSRRTDNRDRLGGTSCL